MKQFYTILILTALFSINASGQDGWIEQNSPSSISLSAVYAIDSLNVWAAGQEGLIIHTKDGGVTWDSIPSGTERSLYTVEFINADTGFVGGREDESSPPLENYLIQRTTDGGLNWEFQHLPAGGQMMIMDIDFIEGPPGEPMRGFSTGGLSHTWRTEDFGETWDHARGDCGEGNFNSCFFVDSITGWFVGTPSNVIPYTIMHTSDGTESFVEQTSPVDIKLNGVCFGTDLKGVAVGNANTKIYTSDGGVTWEQCPDDDFRNITWFSVFLTETGKAWAVGSSGSIAYSIDWGHTWEAQVSGVSDPLWEVHFINETEGWIVGGLSSSVILHTINGGITTTGISDFRDNHTKSYMLEQNYPNPFKSSTQIRYHLNRSNNITLTVYDLSGRKIQTLVDEFQTVGEYSVDWDAAHFCDGLYFYELKVDNDPVEVRKMVLAR
jgi:photosystem II stability/assembly factor-like uncharacterized protein